MAPIKILVVDELSKCGNVREDVRVFVWSSYDTKGLTNVRSVPEWIESNSDSLREEYLRIIFDLGNTLIGSSSVSKLLEIRNGLSAWSASAIAQKCAFMQDEALLDCIKIVALNQLMIELNGDRFDVEIVSECKSRAERIGDFCSTNGYSFKTINNYAVKPPKSALAYAKSALPDALKGFIYLGMIFFKHLGRVKSKSKKNTDGDTIFFDILAHLNHECIRTGEFVSNYWCDLVPLLNDFGVRTTWIHLFYKQKKIKSTREAAGVCDAFTVNSRFFQSHKMVDDLASIGVIFRTAVDYLRLLKRVRYVNVKVESYIDDPMRLIVWRVYRASQIKSLTGVNALLFIFRLNCWDNFLSDFPKQKLGFYLCENQPWEYSLRWAWKKNGHGRLIGVAHSTIRYWDLRYHNDLRYYRTQEYKKIYRNSLAVNGDAALNEMLSASFPIDDLIKVEALRYNYLDRLSHCEFSSKLDADGVLVVGDFLPEINNLVFDYIAMLCKDLNKRLKIAFKPHPEFPYAIPTEIFNLAKIVVINKPFGEIMKNFSTVIAGISSSAAVDAYCSGKKVVQIVDAKLGLNASPLRGWPSVFEAKSYDDFRKFVTDQSAFSGAVIGPRFFEINCRLDRWKNLLKSAHVC